MIGLYWCFEDYNKFLQFLTKSVSQLDNIILLTNQQNWQKSNV